MCPFIDQRFIDHEFLLLLTALQTHVRFEQSVDQFSFLLLRADGREKTKKKTERDKLRHVIQAAAVSAQL